MKKIFELIRDSDLLATCYRIGCKELKNEIWYHIYDSICHGVVNDSRAKQAAGPATL